MLFEKPMSRKTKKDRKIYSQKYNETYYSKNKDKIKEKHCIKVKCHICKKEYTKNNKTLHYRTLYHNLHQKFIDSVKKNIMVIKDIKDYENVDCNKIIDDM